MQNEEGQNVDLYIPRKWCVALLVGGGSCSGSLVRDSVTVWRNAGRNREHGAAAAQALTDCCPCMGLSRRGAAHGACL